jgi:ribosomal protein L29
MQKEKVKGLTDLTLEELEAALKERKKEQAAVRAQMRETYEKERDELVESLIARAKVHNDQLRDFKQYAIDELDKFRIKANAYGDISKKSKGGFSLRHSITQEMVSLDRNSQPEYDERAAMAEELLKQFLEDKVKKKDLQTYRTIAALLEKNKAGDFTPGRIGQLLKIKDNYDDDRWLNAMDLFQESFRIREISYSVSFFTKDVMQKDKAIVLTFASIPVNFKEPTFVEATADEG